MTYISSSGAQKPVTAARGLLSLSPVIVFLLIYLVVSVVIGDFYKMPLVVALLVSSVWAVTIYRHQPLAQRIEVFSKSAGHSNILYMIWVFVLAGAFAALAVKIGAVEATVNFALGFVPPKLVVPALFFAACFISFSIGTSVGTVVALTPLAVRLAQEGGADVPFFVAVVLGGAFFGDNLSFISDTTIAATRSQGCNMQDKFRANIWIVLPAALATMVFYLLSNAGTPATVLVEESDPMLMLPYISIIVLAVLGINVTVVLISGIIVALVMGLVYGFTLLDTVRTMGDGINSMGNLIIITLLSAGMLGMIKATGGINYLLSLLTRHIRGCRGGKGSIAALVALVNLCTANNTVAIITVGPVARDIAARYGITPRQSASLLDTCSCIVQCLIPYGAQTLMACSLAGIAPVAPLPYLYYPFALAIAVVVSILFVRRNPPKHKENKVVSNL